jgi:hypothetical protein
VPHDHHFFRSWLRRIALAAVAALGLAAIVGSGGGGGDAPECSFFSNACNPGFTPAPATPAASIYPFKLTVRAGTSAVFTAQTSGIDRPSFQWQRSADGGANFVDVAGATAATYTLAQAQFADDGAIFRVDVRGGGGNTVLASSNAGTLLVSSLPAVVFSDGEFDPADWSASAIANPALTGPTHSEDRSATGGLPGAFRHMVHTMTAGPSSLRVFNTKASAIYDPQALGAIHAIDYAEDCDRLSATSSSFGVLSYPTIEQAGRHYVSGRGRGCLSLWVNNFNQLPSLEATDFVQVDGPACDPGAPCPDFSARGAPLRFGFERRVSLQAGVPAGSIEHGIDNWRVGVWRP